MIIGIGCDVVNIERFNKSSEFLERFSKRILGKDELREFLNDKNSEKEKVYTKLAKLYAAKEAFSKALGTGFREGIFLSDVQILHDNLGKPYLKIGGEALVHLNKLAMNNSLYVSISDDYPCAMAVVIIESK